MLRSLAFRRGVHVTLVILGLGPGGASAQVVTGTVREDSTGRRLAGVDVIIERTDRRAVTDRAGRFSMSDLAQGSYVALFRLVGFAPQRLTLRISGADTVWANAVLVPSALPLPPLEVTAITKGPRGLGVEAFEERRRLGFGKFIDSTVLRRSEHRRVRDLLQGIPGVRIVAKPIAPGVYEYWAASTRVYGPKGELCFMQVVLDGRVIYRAVAPTGARTRDPPDLEREFEVKTVEAIEIYRSAAETPGEFGGAGAECGTIVLWTRRY